MPGRLEKPWPSAAALILLVVGSSALLAADPAEPRILELDAESTTVTFRLGATLHTVRGTVALTEARFEFEPESGELRGVAVADATSADTGHRKRDRKMHDKVLESERYPRFRFVPERVEGAVTEGVESDIRISGTLELHGTSHEVVIPARVRVLGDRVEGRADFTVPYVEWGLHDPSTFVLRVKKQVEVTVEFAGTVSRGRGT